MKFSLMSMAIAAFGAIWIAIGVIRWNFIYPDPSEVIRTLFEGGGTIIFAYCYNQFRNIDRRFTEQEHNIDLITEKVFRIKTEDKIDKRKYV